MGRRSSAPLALRRAEPTPPLTEVRTGPHRDADPISRRVEEHAVRKKSHHDRATPSRKTVLDELGGSSRNVYCRFTDLSNEASVETFFVSRMLTDLGYKDSQIKTKASLSALTVARGRKREKYKPDFALMFRGVARCIVDAKSVDEPLEPWIEQCSGYCLALNRKHSKSNPVRFFILTNGRTTQLYEWDKDEPVLTLDFADFTWGNPRYDHLIAIVGAQNIASSVPAPLGKEPANFTFARPTAEKARQLFTTCHKAIWKSEVCGPGPAFHSFVKLMFVKLWADKNIRNNADTEALFRKGEASIKLPKSMVSFSVHWIEQRETEGAISPIESLFFHRLRDEIETDIKLRRKKRIFDKDEGIGLRPDTIKDIVRRLEHYDMFGIDEDLNGRLFETFLNATMRGRALGQFFTPRSVVKMMTKLADLQVTRAHQDHVLDACCGSGGFLIEALTIMRNKVRSNASLSTNEKENLIATVSNECLYGIDRGSDPPLARIARINMYLHGDGGSKIYYADSLDKTLDTANFDDDPEVVENTAELRQAIQAGAKFDVVLTNPPFSMVKEAKNPSERRVLEQYDLARKDDSGAHLRPSLRSSVMFLERYGELLKPGGKLITVLDDTLLSSNLFAFVRRLLRERFLIRAIISLPGDTFRRSGSRVKTSVIVLEKKRSRQEKQPTCFAFFSEFLGVDDLTPRASDADIEEARKRAEDETTRIIEGYRAYLAGASSPDILDPDSVAERLDLKFCAPLFGRMESRWRDEGIDVKQFAECVELVEDEVVPSQHPETVFTLIKVRYEGDCVVERERPGKRIRAKKMYRVKAGQLVFSTIRATDGAVGILPAELDGSLVSGSYSVFNCGTPEDTAYLWSVLRSHEIRADMQSLSPGSGRYTSYWPDVGRVPIPWLEKEQRRTVGKSLLKSWELEHQAAKVRNRAMAQIEALGVESPESIKRWESSKAPT